VNSWFLYVEDTMTTAPWRDSKLISRNLINICLLTILTLYVFANLCVCVSCSRMSWSVTWHRWTTS